jgi:hypothetical protein
VRGPSDVSTPRLVFAVLFAGVGFAVVFAAATTSASLDPFNRAWDGTSDLRMEAATYGTDITLVMNTDQYETASPNGSVALVLSPSRPYERVDRQQLAAFVRNGGTLVVAEDFGPQGNTLLSSVGASARFDGRPVRDERYNFRDPDMPVAANATETRVTDQRTELTLNHGTAVDANESTVALTTSRVAYLDENLNDELDRNETIGALPVVTIERVGAGRVVAVGDPSVFLNAMLDRPGNAAFTRSLLRGQHVLFDVSHAGSSPPPLAYGTSVVRDSRPLQGFVGAVGVIVIVVGVRYGRTLHTYLLGRNDDRSARESHVEALVHTLEGRYAHWDQRRIRHVILGPTTAPPEEDDDDGS